MLPFGEGTLSCFFKAINNEPLEFTGTKIYKEGSAEGILWGGNLATVASLCGQDFIPDEDFIFFAEDLNEPVYKIDRMFTQLFNIEKFNAQYAYTIDGSKINELAFENFNAYEVIVDIEGQSIHPGSAKDKMINATGVAMEFDRLLPVQKKPEYTEGYEGFHHLVHINGTCEKARLEYIVREHDFGKLKVLLNDFKRAQAYLNSFYGKQLVSVDMKEQYLNMKTIVLEYPHIIEQVEIAMQDLGITPEHTAIRGGTDGASLCYAGLPTPNLGCGMFNCHGPYEFVSINMMKKGVELLLRIIKNNVYNNENIPF